MNAPLRSLFLTLAALTTSAAAVAQCPLPDNLDGGPCCADTQVRLPKLPPFKQDSFEICWKDCDVDNIGTLTAEWGSPITGTGPTCGPLRAKLRLRDAAGVVHWRGVMTFQYSRTWMEFDPAGLDHQVWRFLVNGDMRPTAAAGPIPCPVAPCAPFHHNNIKYSGYVDYARECSTGKFEFAWMLSHVCDMVDHAQGFPRAGAFHPDRAYTFVGPAATFVVGPIQPTEGGGSGLEAVRRLDVTTVAGAKPVLKCEYEEPCQHGLSPQQQLCPCSPLGTSPQWQLGDLVVAGACGTSVVSNPAGPFLPGFVSMGIGSWVDPSTYPGQEILRWNAGAYDYTEGCTGKLDREVFYGVTTIKGWPAMQVLAGGLGAPLPPIFIDQVNAKRALLPGAGPLMNLPSRGDHFLNLNH